jgi:hypothetical protein
VTTSRAAGRRGAYAAPVPTTATPPGSVRAAGVVVCLQGLSALVFAVALVARAAGGVDRVADVLGEAGYFAALGAGVLAVGVSLVRGRRWARTPVLVVQLLLLGVAWYAAGPSGRPEYGVPVGLLCLATAVALLTARARAWAYRPPAE